MFAEHFLLFSPGRTQIRAPPESFSLPSVNTSRLAVGDLPEQGATSPKFRLKNSASKVLLDAFATILTTTNNAPIQDHPFKSRFKIVCVLSELYIWIAEDANQAADLFAGQRDAEWGTVGARELLFPDRTHPNAHYRCICIANFSGEIIPPFGTSIMKLFELFQGLLQSTSPKAQSELRPPEWPSFVILNCNQMFRQQTTLCL